MSAGAKTKLGFSTLARRRSSWDSANMLRPAKTYSEALRQFRWHIPERYNLGVDVSDRHDTAGMDGMRTALIILDMDDCAVRVSFRELKWLSNRLANVLRAHNVMRGDRVGVLLEPSLECALAHIAILKIGAVSVPLYCQSDANAWASRLEHAEASYLITDTHGAAKLQTLRAPLSGLAQILAVDGGPGALDFWDALDQASDNFAPLATSADDPAILFYPPEATDQPKGVLHAHRALLGYLPGMEFCHGFFPQMGDLFWSPIEWAGTSGLFGGLFASLHHGVPVLVQRNRPFDPEKSLRLIAQHGVRNVFLPPGALRQIHAFRDVKGLGRGLRSLATGGEALGAELLEWGRSAFGLSINEIYGQTECGPVVGNCAGAMDVRPGCMGCAIPGHRVEIIDDAGDIAATDSDGQFAVRRYDPALFLEYWRAPEATEQKFLGDWLLTGDQGRKDSDDYFRFLGRNEDLIASAKGRIGPIAIEDCLMRHPAVAMAAAIGVPETILNPAQNAPSVETVKAFLVLRPDVRLRNRAEDEALAQDIQSFVKSRLAAHEYPRVIEFVESLPLTTTGKIKRKELRAAVKRGKTPPVKS